MKTLPLRLRETLNGGCGGLVLRTGGAEKQDVEWVDSWRLENDELGGLAQSFAKCFASNKV